jgi:orotidine-5'-phosphate decarboxylase
MMINSSRAILYASSGADFAEAARAVAIETCDALRTASAL